MSREIGELVKKFEKVLANFPEVKYAGDPVLRQTAREVSTGEGVRIGKRLGEILMRYRNAVGYGRGFAAPHLLQRMVYIKDDGEEIRTELQTEEGEDYSIFIYDPQNFLKEIVGGNDRVVIKVPFW